MEQLSPSGEKITPNNFDEITLNPEETAEALRKGREEKSIQLKKEKYWLEVTSTPVYKRYTPVELYQKLSQTRNPKGELFKIDDENKQQVINLCLYFAGDPKFEATAGMSLSKGLMLMGNVGVGKTHMMSFFFQNQHESYVMANCRTIADKWVNQEEGIIERYSQPIKCATNSNPFGAVELGVCFDDLGTEVSPSKAYGQEKNVLSEILMNRYENRIPYNLTHITTNLSAGDLEAKYGIRVRDRLREMCNLITFDKKAKSRR